MSLSRQSQAGVKAKRPVFRCFGEATERVEQTSRCRADAANAHLPGVARCIASAAVLLVGREIDFTPVSQVEVAVKIGVNAKDAALTDIVGAPDSDAGGFSAILLRRFWLGAAPSAGGGCGWYTTVDR